MAIKINSNVPSLNAQRTLSQTDSEFQKVGERLSTGLRINRAGDDAAGLAIASDLNVQGRTLEVANRNINDGISAINVMQGAMSAQSGILNRLSELAEQSANGVYSDKQRIALSKEYEALVAEYGRIAETTAFNGQYLLRGQRAQNSSFTLQVGVDGSAGSRITLDAIDSGSNSGVLNFANAIDPGPLLAQVLDFEEFAALFDQQIRRVEGTDSAGNARTVYIAVVSNLANTVGSLSWVVPSNFGGAVTEGIEDVVNAVDLVRVTQTRMNVDSATGNLSPNSFTERTFGTSDPAIVDLDYSGIRMSSTNPAEAPLLERDPVLEFTGIETVNRSRKAIELLQAKRESLARKIASLGGVDSRLNVAIANNQNARINLADAESKIVNADVAKEAADFARLGILKRAGAAVLSQANLQPALALRLLES